MIGEKSGEYYGRNGNNNNNSRKNSKQQPQHSTAELHACQMKIGDIKSIRTHMHASIHESHSHSTDWSYKCWICMQALVSQSICQHHIIICDNTAMRSQHWTQRRWIAKNSSDPSLFPACVCVPLNVYNFMSSLRCQTNSIIANMVDYPAKNNRMGINLCQNVYYQFGGHKHTDNACI